MLTKIYEQKETKKIMLYHYSKLQKNIYYCPYCHTSFNDDNDKEDDDDEEFEWLKCTERSINDKIIDMEKAVKNEKHVDINNDKFKCPTCEKVFFSTQKYNFKKIQQIIPKGYDLVEKYNINIITNKPNIQRTYLGLFTSDEGKIIVFSGGCYYALSSNEKIIMFPFVEKFIINCKTGQSYYMPPYNKETGRTIWARNSKFCNWTFKSNMPMFMSSFSSVLQNLIINSFIQLKGLNPEEFNDIYYEDICKINRYPNYFKKSSTVKINQTLFMCPSMNASTKYLSRKIRKIVETDGFEEETVAKKLIETSRIPKTKAFRRLYCKDITNIARVKNYLDAGIEDNNNILKLMPYDYLRSTNEKKFYKKTREILSENVAVNKIISCKQYYIYQDTARMYVNISESRPELIPDNVLKLKIKDIHDQLSMLVTKLQYENKEITYSEFESELEDSINGYDFKLAVDTNELVKIGSDMRICVGSYREQALKKYCTILSISKDNQYECCIELTVNKKSVQVVQVKGIRNNYIKDKIADTFIEWAEKHEISYKECHDCQHFTDDTTQYGGDYHQLELVNGEVIQRVAEHRN